MLRICKLVRLEPAQFLKLHLTIYLQVAPKVEVEQGRYLWLSATSTVKFSIGTCLLLEASTCHTWYRYATYGGIYHVPSFWLCFRVVSARCREGGSGKRWLGVRGSRNTCLWMHLSFQLIGTVAVAIA